MNEIEIQALKIEFKYYKERMHNAPEEAIRNTNKAFPETAHPLFAPVLEMMERVLIEKREIINTLCAIDPIMAKRELTKIMTDNAGADYKNPVKWLLHSLTKAALTNGGI